MRQRPAESLQSFGYIGNVEDFRVALAEIKVGQFADWYLDEFILTCDEAAKFCRLA